MTLLRSEVVEALAKIAEIECKDYAECADAIRSFDTTPFEVKASNITVVPDCCEGPSEPCDGYVSLLAKLAERDKRIAELEGEVAAVREDAERYRWLASRAKEFPEGWYFAEYFAGAPSLETLNDVIDAARKT